MGPDVRNTSFDRDLETDSVEALHPMMVMLEQGRQVRRGQLVALGRRHARIRTQERLHDGDDLVLTVSLPESRSEKTRAMFRLSSRVRAEDNDDGRGDYVVHFSTDDENLDAAGKLYARVRSRGIVEV